MPTTAEQRFARRKETAIDKVTWRLASHHPESVLSMIKEVDEKLHGSTPLVRNTARDGVLRAAAEEIVNQVQKDLGLGSVRVIYKDAPKKKSRGRAGRPPGVLHWTQKPENKRRVRAALRKANKAKAEKKAAGA